MATIEIFMLGNFEIRVDGQPVLAQLNQSRKATALVQYLVLQRGAPVPHKVLIDTLWGGERCANPDMALRAILHRFRSMISQEQLTALESCILTSRGCYQWNPNLTCTVDVFQLEDLAAAAEQCEDPDKRLEHYQQIETLYRGRLLPLSASEPWVESIAMHLHAYYRTAMLALLEHYRKQGDSERLVALCERGLEKNPRVERLYLELIMALEDLGRHSDAQLAARYSDTQYALLMCGTGGEDSTPLEHIKQAFYRIPTRERYLMNYRVCAPRAGQKKPRARRARAVRKTKETV